MKYLLLATALGAASTTAYSQIDCETDPRLMWDTDTHELAAVCDEVIDQPIEDGFTVIGGKICIHRGLWGSTGDKYLSAYGEVYTDTNQDFQVWAMNPMGDDRQDYAYEDDDALEISEFHGWIPVLTTSSYRKTFTLDKETGILTFLQQSKDAFVHNPNPFRGKHTTFSVRMHCRIR